MISIDKIRDIVFKFLKIDNNIYYIEGSEKLPSPLLPEEEQKLLIRLKNKDNEARKRLVEKNLRLVVYIAKKFENTGINIEDLISIGTIGLMKAINSFDLDKNIKLATYASRCIENEILMHLRKIVKIRSEVSIDEPLNTDSEGNDLLLADIIGTDIDQIFIAVEESSNKKKVIDAIEKLNKRDKVIMNLRYGFNGKDELTQKEVADRLGISQSYISRIEKKVINGLKKELLK
ncbi:MAG: RNA polymerase sporulation sigma factor SigK [Clostridia bacterium]